MYNTRIGTFLFALFMVFATTLHARVHHIEPGEGRISAILSSLAPNDTLMLASNGVYMVFAIAVFTFGGYRIANWRIRERAEHQALEETRSELETHVAERTAELRASNIKLQREVAERLRAEDALRDAHNQLEVRVANRIQEVIRYALDNPPKASTG